MALQPTIRRSLLGIPSMDIMAEAAKRPKKTWTEEASKRPDKSKSQTGFYSLVRAKKIKRMKDSLIANRKPAKIRQQSVSCSPANVINERLHRRL